MVGALVIYKGKPAWVEQTGEKWLLRLADGSQQKVRPKDVWLLHPGPVSFPLEPKLPTEAEAAWELLQGEEVELATLAELLYGQYTPQSAYGAYRLAQEGFWFTLEGTRIRARRREELETLRQKQAAREAYQAAIARLAQGEDVPELRQEIEALALGRRQDSPVLRALGLAETPESAQAYLIQRGYWRYQNPHPSRLGLRLSPPDLPLPSLAEENRRDLTHLPALAIDDEGSQDPDDAVWVERQEEGFRLYVHVADVAALVWPDSPLDLEARRRGANLYLPEGTVGMLPPAATLELGLGLKETSPALSFELELSLQGEVRALAIYPSWVRVERLSYAEALHRPELAPLAELAQIFRARRLAQGAFELALPEVKVRVEGEAVRLAPLPPYESRVWVREAMLLAGQAAAGFALEHRIPFPFATQEAPEASLEAIPEGLAGMWALRRRIKRAQLRTTPGPHRGLGLPWYAQVTSPLRRYLDLVAHQQLRAFLVGKPLLSRDEVLLRVGAAEAVADLVREAERKSREHWTLVHLLQHGYCGPGVLVEPRGVFLLPELGLSTSLTLGQALPLNSTRTLCFVSADLSRLSSSFRLS